MATRLDVRSLTMRYGAYKALDRINLDVKAGHFLCLLGPSGCGKTTLLRCIAGITQPTEGEVCLNDTNINDRPPERRNLGMVFQTYALFPHMSVRRNVRFGLDMRGVRRADAIRRVDRALALVGLTDYANRLPRDLSGGQQQRVAVARAIVIEPDLLLFDEPLSNLDAKLRESLREDLRFLQQDLGITSVYVTHDQAEAMAIADEIVVMNAGQIVERGSPVDLYRRPRHRFTAEFLGLTNVIDAETDGITARMPWGETRPLARSLEGTRPISVAIRPEDLQLSAVGRDDEGDATIEEMVFLGATVQYRLRAGEITLRAAASGGDHAVLERGQAVRLTAPSEFHVLEESLDA